MAVIEVESLGAELGGKRVLDSVTLTISSGEVAALVGPNGAGKTTLLRALLGLLPVSSGSIRVFDRPLSQLAPDELARLVGYVPQRLQITFPYAVQEFLSMSRYAHSASAGNASAIEEALRLTNLQELAFRPLTELSGGETQRALLAAALVQKPKLLILDEPAASLDPKHAKAMHQLMQELASGLGLTVLAVSHDVNAAARHSSRIIALKEGRVFFDGPPREFVQGSVLEGLYDVPFERFALPSSPGAAVLPEL